MFIFGTPTVVYHQRAVIKTPNKKECKNVKVNVP
jgi:hypothetical protein